MKNKNPSTPKTGDKKQEELPGYPIYPASEDIYNHGQKVDGLELDDISKTAPLQNIKPENANVKDFEDDVSGDLDIPGSELDDQLEIVGSEDEENNYYSLGGDGHNDLEEDRS